MNKPSKTRILCLSELALLAALVLLMAFTPLGYLQTPWGLQITFIVVPVAIGAVILGPGAGAALGLIFGLTSFANSFTSALGSVFLQENAFFTFILAVVPRILVGLLPGLLYAVLKKHARTRTVGMAVCCLLTPLLNTLLYMSTLSLLFGQTWLGIAQGAGYGGDGGISLLGFMLASVAVNGVAEAAACLILGTAVCAALQKTVNRKAA